MDRVQVAPQPSRLTGWVGRTRTFLVGVREEMRKVTWPTRDELITPIAMDEGLRFAIREGGRTVGAGVVTKILK